MFQIIYASEASIAFSADDLAQLLALARLNNSRDGVTGMLVFCEGQFLQVLEGEAATVIATFARIEQDTRHKTFSVLHRGYSHVGRAFEDWSMGFHSIAAKDVLPAGFVRINNRIDLSQFDGLSALDFLMACRPRPVAAA